MTKKTPDLKDNLNLGELANDDIESEGHRSVDPALLKQELEQFLKKEAPRHQEAERIIAAKTKSSRQQQPVEQKHGLSLGELLIQNGYITKDQLEIALKEQRESHDKKELGTILMELSFISDSALSTVLEKFSGIKTINVRNYKINEEVLQKIPREFAVEYKIIALDMLNNELYIATSDVYNVLALDKAKKFFSPGVKLIPYFANDYQITEVIDNYYEYEVDLLSIVKEIESGGNAYQIDDANYINPTVRLIDSILLNAVKLGASDVHLEPEKEFIRLRYRIDGRLVQMLSFHKQYWPAILVRLKIISNLNIAENKEAQDGRISISVMGRKVDFRVSVMPTVHGENFVARILDIKRSLVPLSELGLSDEYSKLIKILLKRPEGIIIITGPTGSGKTTTLYSMMSHMNSLDINITTLENPVEYQLPVIRQTSIRDEVGITFSGGITALMRQDPDVILIGEVRDNDTATMTIRAAMTGHLVFTTLHTNDSIGAIARLSDLGIKPQLMSGSIICCIAQRLLRKLCIHCKEQYTATHDDCIILGVEDMSNPPTLYRHKGCDRCFNTGYRGVIAVYEILAIDKDLDELIAIEATRKEIYTYARSKGFKTMAEDGMIKVMAGISDIDELINTVDVTERLKNVSL